MGEDRGWILNLIAITVLALVGGVLLARGHYLVGVVIVVLAIVGRFGQALEDDNS